MTLRIRTCRLAAVVAAATCVAAACSSSSDSTESSTDTPSTATSSPSSTAVPSTTTPPSTAPTTTAAPATTEPPPTTSPATTEPPPTTAPDEEFTDAELADRELARTALITLEMFPDGWAEDPVEDDEDDDSDTEEFEAEFDTCLGRDDAERIGDDLEERAVSTGDFHPVDSDAPSVSHEVVLAPDEATAVTVMSEVGIDGAEPCLADVIQAFYVQIFSEDPELADIAIGDVIVTRTEIESEPDVAVGVMLEVPLTIGDETVSQFLEILYQRQGRALSELSFFAFGEPFDRDGYAMLSDEVGAGLAAVGT